MTAPGQLLCGERSLARRLCCAICGRARKERVLGGEFHDLGILYGARAGIIGVNVRYCKDDLQCVEKAKNWSVQR